jgi:hypothetical protein
MNKAMRRMVAKVEATGEALARARGRVAVTEGASE